MLRIGPEHLLALQAHGREAHPAIGTGLLFGFGDPDTGYLVTAVHPCRLNEDSGRVGLRLDPQEYLRLQTLADEEGLEVVGMYRSLAHSSQPPPSQELHGAYPTWSYLAVDCREGETPSPRCFRVGDGEEGRTFLEEEVQVLAPLTGRRW